MVQTTIYCIGLSRYHDAKLLNSLAQAGSNIGNFVYIDTSKDDYKDTMKEALSSSLNMALASSGKSKISFKG